MPDNRARICNNCDGFPVVAIDAGYRRNDGTRATLKVVCSVCDGTGTDQPARPAPSAVKVGAAA
jgi:RNase P subunit RPR2